MPILDNGGILIMDIAALSTALAQSAVQQQASVQLLHSALGQIKTAGNDLVTLMQSAPGAQAPLLPEYAGRHVDLYV